MAYKDSEQRRGQKAEYRARNREKIRERDRVYAREYRAGNRAVMRIALMRSRHGMSPGDWAALWAAQDGCCYLCGDDLTEGAAGVDHDHRCCPRNYSCRGCRRGLACDNCNSAIGMARDDPARLRRMADALEAAQLLVDQRQAEAGERVTLF